MGFTDFFTIVYDWSNILQLFAVSFSVAFVMHDPWKGKKEYLKLAIDTLILFALETVVELLLFILSHYVRFFAGINFPLAYLISIFIYVAFFCKFNLSSKIVIGTTMFITAIDIAELGSRASQSISMEFAFKYSDAALVVADVLVVAFAFIIRNYSVHKFNEIPYRSVIYTIIITATAATFIFTCIILTMPTGDGGMVITEELALPDNRKVNVFFTLALTLIYIVSVVSYMVIYFGCKEYDEKLSAKVENERLKANQTLMVVSDQAMEEVRGIRHDIGNQYGVIRMLIKEKKYDELEKYFNSMNIEFEDIVRFVNCKNSLLNSIINMEILKAKSYKIKIVCVINVPEKIPMADTDLARLMINLIDNAIEALQRVDIEDKIIDLSVSFKNDYLYINIQNAFARNDRDEEEILKLNTLKDDEKKHGYGHKIVRKIVKKHNGEISYLVENNEFIVEAMLDLKSLKEKNDG